MGQVILELEDITKSYGEVESKQFVVSGHDGIFLVKPDDVDKYLETYKPIQF